MLGGTGSDVGKSMLAAGLCRIFRQDGYSPAPFKAQNMALNSYATPDGKEIGRAQAVQAEAAGIPCSTDMNPLLLKPSGDMMSQVVLNGKPIGNRNAYDFYRNEGRDFLRQEVNAAFSRLEKTFNPIVMEGAGSIAELNLRDSDLVNIPMARHAGARVILVADIDRGGVFASVYGSIMLQTEEDRKLIRGIIINKFRGDKRLFESGAAMLEKICSVPVLGVVPYAPHIHIEEEDSVALDAKKHEASAGKVNIAVIRLPRISNYTDFDALEHDPRVNLYYVQLDADISDADIIVIPGSKATISDLSILRSSGMEQKIKMAHSSGKTVVGICGGYQMMGLEVCDPQLTEGGISRLNGIGLLPVRTVLAPEKTTRQVSFRHIGCDGPCSGYEIHTGVSTRLGGEAVNILADGSEEGCRVSANCFGSYIHGILDNACVVESLLAPFTVEDETRHFDYRSFRESQYDALADLLRENIDMEKLYEIMKR